MKYHIEIVRSAQKEIERLPDNVEKRLRPIILSLESIPRPHGSKKLRETDRYRLRIGSYRVIYTINDKDGLIRILAVRHRKEAYR